MEWKTLIYHSFSMFILLSILLIALFGSKSISLAKQTMMVYENNKSISKFSNYVTFEVSTTKENIDNNNITYYIDAMYELYNVLDVKFKPIILDASSYNTALNEGVILGDSEQPRVYVNQNYIDTFNTLPNKVYDQLLKDTTNILIHRDKSELNKPYINERDNLIFYDDKIEFKVFDALSKIAEYPDIIVLSGRGIRDFMFNYFSNSQIFIELKSSNDSDQIKDIVDNSKLSNVLQMVEVNSGNKQMSLEIMRELIVHISEIATLTLAILVLMCMQREMIIASEKQIISLILYRIIYVVGALIIIYFLGKWFIPFLVMILLFNLDLMSAYRKKNTSNM